METLYTIWDSIVDKTHDTAEKYKSLEPEEKKKIKMAAGGLALTILLVSLKQKFRRHYHHRY